MANDGMTNGAKIRVWDLPTRAFHWTLVCCVAGSWWSGSAGKMDLHFILGYVAMGLLALRLVWGFVGFHTARFSQFVKGPKAALAYVRYRLGLPGGAEPPLGHNPIGGWMVVVILLVLAAQAATGLFTSDDITVEGPLTAYVSAKTVAVASTIHRIEANVILALVLAHVSAITIYLLAFKENLVRPMITGWKRAEQEK